MITRTGILNSSSVADRGAAYLAGTGRSVGRGRDLLASYQIGSLPELAKKKWWLSARNITVSVVTDSDRSTSVVVSSTE